MWIIPVVQGSLFCLVLQAPLSLNDGVTVQILNLPLSFFFSPPPFSAIKLVVFCKNNVNNVFCKNIASSPPCGQPLASPGSALKMTKV